MRAHGKYFLDKLTCTSIASRYGLINEKGREVRVIKEDYNPLEDYKLGEVSIFMIKVSDSTDL